MRFLPFSSYNELFIKSCLFMYPTCIWHPRWGDPIRILLTSLASENWSPWAVMWRCLHDSTFSHFHTILACDRWTDKHTTTAYSALA